jgi:alpha-ketoglutaric semialdehyde dehydrogenase
MTSSTKSPESAPSKAGSPRTYHNYIDGKWVKAETGETFASYNPANLNEVIGHFASSTPKDVKAAVDAAQNALYMWRHTPAPARADIILKAAYLLESRKEEIATTMVREMGKVLKEARGDVQDGSNRSIRNAEQIRNGNQTTNRRCRFDHSVEFPGRNSFLEDVPGSRCR